MFQPRPPPAAAAAPSISSSSTVPSSRTDRASSSLLSPLPPGSGGGVGVFEHLVIPKEMIREEEMRREAKMNETPMQPQSISELVDAYAVKLHTHRAGPSTIIDPSSSQQPSSSASRALTKARKQRAALA